MDRLKLYSRLIFGRLSPKNWPLLEPYEFDRASTRDVIADSCRVLAMLWDSAWHEGNGQATDENLLKAVPADDLIALYSAQWFLRSLWLDDIGRILRAEAESIRTRGAFTTAPSLAERPYGATCVPQS
jgi:hypothetical protein